MPPSVPSPSWELTHLTLTLTLGDGEHGIDMRAGRRCEDTRGTAVVRLDSVSNELKIVLLELS